MRYGWPCLLLPLLLVLAAGCGSGDSPGSPSTGAPGQPAGGEQATPAKEYDPFDYRGPDREEQLRERARSEGKVKVYSSTALPPLQALAKGFQEKHGVEVEHWRANGETVVQRVLQEARAGSFDADVVDNNSIEQEIFRREGITRPFHTPLAEYHPVQNHAEDGLWYGYRVSIYTQAYNTNLVSQAELPRTYEDLLDPKWKGKLAIEGANEAWFATMVKHWGEEKGLEYFRRLGQQELQVRDGFSLLAELVASGEIPYSINVLNWGPEGLKKKGAPIEWHVLEPAVGRPQAIGITRAAPHPNAAVLFADFLLGEEGQRILRETGQVTTHRDVPPDPPSLVEGIEWIPIDSRAMAEEYDRWYQLWNDLVISPKQ